MISIPFNRADKVKFMLRSPLTLASILLFALGLSLFFRYGGFNGLNDLRYAFSKTAVVDGYITDAQTSSAELDYEDIYHFSFPVDGNTVYGSSFTTHYYYDMDQRVEVEYIVSNPDISRIVGTSDNPEYSSIIGLIVMLVAPVLAIFPYRKLKKLQAILDDASLIQAPWRSTEETMVEINEETLYKLTYSFEVDGKYYEVYKRSTTPSRFQKDVTVVYNNTNPHKNMLVEKLPNVVRKKVVASSRGKS